MFVYMNLHAENAKPPCFRLAVIFIKKEGVSQVLNMSQPAAYVPDAPCVRPFRKERVSQVLNMSEDPQSTSQTPHAFAPSAQNIA